MTYAELVAAIQSTTENTFETVDVNRFIEQAEFRVYNAVQFPALRKTGSLSTVNGMQYVDAPSDFLSPESLAYIDGSTGAYTFLLNKDPSFIREAYPTVTATGTPVHYGIYGPALTVSTPNKELRFIIGPTPAGVYSLELQYFAYPESITTVAGGQTWLGDNYSPALLYGALVEAYVFMKGDKDLMDKYDQMFKDALVEAKRMGDGLQKQDTYRSGQKRQAVT